MAILKKIRFATIESQPLTASIYETPTGPIPSVLTLNANKSQVEIGETVTFSGQLTASDGTPVGGFAVTIEITDENGNMDSFSAGVTGNAGTYSIGHAFNQIGTYIVVAKVVYESGGSLPPTQSTTIPTGEELPPTTTDYLDRTTDPVDRLAFGPSMLFRRGFLYGNSRTITVYATGEKPLIPREVFLAGGAVTAIAIIGYAFYKKLWKETKRRF